MTYYNIFFLLSFLLSIFYVFRYQKHFDVNITAIFLLIPIANLGNVFMAYADNLDQALVANRITYLGGIYLTFFITFSIFNLCEIKVPALIRTLLLVMNSVVYGFVLTTGNNPYFYKTVSFTKVDGLGMLVKEYGHVHTVFYLLILFYLLTGFFTILYTLFWKKQVSRVMLYLLFLPEFFTVIGYLGGKISGSTLEIAPMSYVFAQIVYLLIAERLTLYQVSDTTIETMLENGQNGFLTMNLNHRYLGSNERAKEIFPGIGKIPIDGDIAKDEDLKKYVIRWVETFEKDNEKSEQIYIKMPEGEKAKLADKHTKREEVLTEKNDEYENAKFYTVQLSYLFSGRNKIGYQLYFIDDTENIRYIRLLNNLNKILETEVEKKTERIVEMHDNLVLSMASMVESRDNSTGGHIRRTSDCIKILIEEIKKDNKLNLSDKFCKDLIKAAPMHDLGKIAVPDRILQKEGRFEPKEFDEMKKHAAEGARIVHDILKDTDDFEFHLLAENVAHYHHERYNGSGYPEGLKGEEIPIEARIMAVADVYDALVSKRCYKEKMSFEEADKIIMDGMGTHFDPQLEEYYVAARPKLEEYYAKTE